MHPRMAATAAVLSFPFTALLAQTQNHLVGLTRVQSDLRHFDQHACAPLAQCGPVGFPSGSNLPDGAGGTAWDPIASGAWITNGSVLALVDDQCNYLCGPLPILLPVGAVVTGLEVAESRRALFMVDDQFNIREYSLGCPPVPVGSCQIPLPGPITPTTSTSGLAIDEGLGFVFTALTDFATGDNVILVSSLASPCSLMQRLPIQGCPTGAGVFRSIRGLAVDWCARILYATDGRDVMAISYQPAATQGIVVTGVRCCNPLVATPDPMAGLAVRPGRATTNGQSCANGVCPNCAMRHSLGNDPNLGNLAFHLDIDQAPAASLAWDVIGFGPCQNAGPVIFPLCGPVLTRPVLGTIGPLLTGGVAGLCSGGGSFRLGLPANAIFCGQIISSQVIAVCTGPGSQFGFAMSNCLSFELQGN